MHLFLNLAWPQTVGFLWVQLALVNMICVNVCGNQLRYKHIPYFKLQTTNVSAKIQKKLSRPTELSQGFSTNLTYFTLNSSCKKLVMFKWFINDNTRAIAPHNLMFCERYLIMLLKCENSWNKTSLVSSSQVQKSRQPTCRKSGYS